jgi:hypothetical protein
MAKDIRWLTIANAADMACCDQKTIRRAVRSGYLRAVHGGDGDLRFLESWIDEWLANQLLPENDDADLVVDAASLRRELALW